MSAFGCIRPTSSFFPCRRTVPDVIAAARILMQRKMSTNILSGSSLFQPTTRLNHDFTRQLKPDTKAFSRSDPRVPPWLAQRDCFYTFVDPEPSPKPVLVSVSAKCCQEVGMDPSKTQCSEFLEVFSGGDVKAVVKDARPYAHNYSGFQFGVWAGQLGDGRAITLFETETPKRYAFQLKGAGRTPYSRFGDGYAVLRSSIREYICSEYMASINIPTSRALSLVTTGGQVLREDGPEPGAIVCRVSESWIRFGSFEGPFHKGQQDMVKELADFVIEKYYSDVCDQDMVVEMEGKTAELNKQAKMFKEVVRRTALMISGWMSIGFQHGVMNTDNMSILGLTIDYGPFGFMDNYDPTWICNHSDDTGRYRFDAQPSIASWNLARLGIALSDLITGEGATDETKAAIIRAIVGEFGDIFANDYRKRMMDKIGFFGLTPDQMEKEYEETVVPLLKVFALTRVDYTNFFRALCDFQENPQVCDALIGDGAKEQSDGSEETEKEILKDWYIWRDKYSRKLQDYSIMSSTERREQMRRVNPLYIPRNWILQEIIEKTTETYFNHDGTYKEDADLSRIGEEVDRAMRIIVDDPFGLKEGCYRDEEDRKAAERWSGPVPSWGQSIQCSCSS